MTMNKILIAEDEAPIANLVRSALEGADYRCAWAADGAAAADLLEREPFDLALLDIMLPKADGYELLEYCKSLEVPVIFLTAKGQLNDRVKGLRLGAEDYIVKPFELMELLARVETVLRRCGKIGRVLTLPPDIEIDTASHVVKRAGEPVALTAKEYDLLLLFVQNKNIALYRDRIYERVWGEEFLGDSRTVDLHIQRMRKKLGLEGQLVAVYKVGYRLEV
jgi:DNA-binding response OmpR family regulator